MAHQPRQLKGYILFKILTKGIYTTFTRAIKEAVSNAYDAGADNVAITFDPPSFLVDQAPEELTIQIRDDGKGISLDEFWDKFASIESEKDPTKQDPTTSRFPVGQFGIGSFALAPFARGLTLYSKRNRQRPIKCVIDTLNLQSAAPDDFAKHVSNNITAQEIDDEQWATVAESKDAGTVIVINGVTHDTYLELVEGTGRFDDNGKALFSDAPFTTGLKEIAWELSTLLPLHYADDDAGVYKLHKSDLRSTNPGIAISLSEVPLYRHIYSRPDSLVRTIAYRDTEHGVRAKGIIVVIPQGAIEPRQANGVILRLNNIGIGSYSRFGLVGQTTMRQRITGEIHILSGLHDALNAPRDRFSGPVFDKLRKHITDALTELSKEGYTDWASHKAKDADRKEKERARKYKKAHHRKEHEGKKKPTHGKKSGGDADQTKPTTSHARSQTTSETSDAFSDPVIELRASTGTMRVDESHLLFKKFKGKAEKETIKLVLRALHLAEVPPTHYRHVIESLISLK